MEYGYWRVWLYYLAIFSGVYIRGAPIAPKVPDAVERSGAAYILYLVKSGKNQVYYFLYINCMLRQVRNYRGCIQIIHYRKNTMNRAEQQSVHGSIVSCTHRLMFRQTPKTDNVLDYGIIDTIKRNPFKWMGLDWVPVLRKIVIPKNTGRNHPSY